jgi:hypothetical protein
MAEVTRNGDRIEIGESVRIEKGPPLRRRKATTEALSDTATATHYQLGSLDALGKPIEEGKMFAFLDYFAEPVFYVFKRRAITAEDQQFALQPDGSTPPLNDDTTNIREYTYIFEDRGTRATEDEAIELGLQLAAEGE